MMKNNANTYQTVLDSIADGVFTVDPEFTISYFNKAAESITGISRTDAISRKCWEVFHADVCEQACLLKKTFTSGKPCINKTIGIITRTGNRIPVSVSTALIRDKNGEIIGGVETFRDLSVIEELRKEVLGKYTFTDIITTDYRMYKIFDMLPAIARSTTPVLILGESGTGKELLAKALHNLSGRADKPFVPVNCGALPEQLLESELFGYRKGAFTDAKENKPGRFDRAREGTLFLDEIGDMPLSLQVKILRAIQDNTFEPLGASAPVKANVRFITATNKNLAEAVAHGAFRKDLFYRINVITLTLPPLRERKNDIPLLIKHFITHYNHLNNKSIAGMSDEAVSLLMQHDYPGNIRELENIIHHAIILCLDDYIQKQHFPDYVVQGLQQRHTVTDTSVSVFEKNIIILALENNRFSRSKTAKQLGINPATLWRKIKKFGISV